MLNQAMQRKLERGECIAVEDVLQPNAETGPAYVGVYQLRDFTDNVDYCVRTSEEWIWSIGRRVRDGAIFAATDNRFYLNPAFDCLFLR